MTLRDEFNPQPKPEKSAKKEKKHLKRSRIKSKKLKNEHTNNYYKHFGFVKGDFVPCEVCGCEAEEIHHIVPRSSFGSKSKGIGPRCQDHITNIMAVCKKHHDEAHASNMRKKLMTMHMLILAEKFIC